MFDFIKKLFKEKEQDKGEVPLSNNNNYEIKEDYETKTRNVEHPCEICKQMIGAERYTKKQGYFFHKSCYKKTLRGALNGKL